jgi:hypothetical protein
VNQREREILILENQPRAGVSPLKTIIFLQKPRLSHPQRWMLLGFRQKKRTGAI